MTALEDTRPLAELSVIPRPDHRAEDLGTALQELLAVDPDIELASIRITTGQVDAGERVSIAGRVGALVDGEPACPSCHVHGQQPHTEYCQLAKLGDLLIEDERKADTGKYAAITRPPGATPTPNYSGRGA